MEEKDIVKATLHYEDGSVEEVEKGIMIEQKTEADNTVTTFYPVGMNVLDIADVTTALIQYADKLGIFNNVK